MTDLMCVIQEPFVQRLFGVHELVVDVNLEVARLVGVDVLCVNAMMCSLIVGMM